MTKSKNLGMRILSLALCLVCLLPCLMGVSATDEETKEQTLTTMVHNGSSYRSTVIGQMEDGTQVTVLDRAGDFYKVDCYDMTGYIAASQITEENGQYYIKCQEDSTETGVMEYTDYAEALALRHSLLELAQAQLGKPYIYGSIGTRGFDCSGLMYYLYSQHGTELQRRASQQLSDGIIVAKEGLQVGDLIFFRETYETYPASHVGIYAGNNKIIHAGSNGIEYADLDYSYFYDYYLCARRVVNTKGAAVTEPATVVTATSAMARSLPTGRRTAQ